MEEQRPEVALPLRAPSTRLEDTLCCAFAGTNLHQTRFQQRTRCNGRKSALDFATPWEILSRAQFSEGASGYVTENGFELRFSIDFWIEFGGVVVPEESFSVIACAQEECFV